MGPLLPSALPQIPNICGFLLYVTFSSHMSGRDGCWDSVAEQRWGKEPVEANASMDCLQ